MKHNKLVRDNVPEIIAKEGKAVTYRILDDEEYKVALEEKLDEEVIEYHDSKSVEEIADIVEVLNAIIKANGHSRFEVFVARMKKKMHKGGFKRRAFLEEVKEEEKTEERSEY
jgi:predicted house-cleaning noncanonical NTP pyrophosphatase (MazG superfamily)